MTRPPPPPTIPVPGSSATRAPTGNGDASRPAPPALGARPGPDLIDAQILLDVLDGVIRGISSVALTLSAARSLTDGPGTVRLDRALDELDDLVQQLRHADKARTGPGAAPAGELASRTRLGGNLAEGNPGWR